MEEKKLDFTPVPASERDTDAIIRPSVRYWPEVGRRLLKSKLALFCMAIVVLYILLAIFVPIFSPYSYDATDFASARLKPCWDHWFGTDEVGRDVFTRIWFGARNSLLIGLLGALVPYFIGMILGALAGWCGGWVDMIIMRIADIMLCIPSMIYMILILILLGGNVMSLTIAFAIGGWMGAARGFRARVIQFKNREFVLAADALGAKPSRIIFRHILPNILGNMAVGISASIPGAIMMESGMSFIGLGVTAPQTSLGKLSATGVQYYASASLSHLFWAPSIILAVLIFAFFMFGNCVRDALDPRLRDEEYNIKGVRKRRKAERRENRKNARLARKAKREKKGVAE